MLRVVFLEKYYCSRTLRTMSSVIRACLRWSAARRFALRRLRIGPAAR